MARGNDDTELQVGDVVTVLGRIDPGRDEEFRMGWVAGDMDNVIGKTGKVYECSTYDYNGTRKPMYKIDGCTTFWWIAEWLDIQVPDELFSDEDFETVFV